jgi:hypothetical protein
MWRANGCFSIFCDALGWSDVTRHPFSLSPLPALLLLLLLLLLFLRNIGKSKSLSLHSSMGSGRSDHNREPKTLDVRLNGVEYTELLWKKKKAENRALTNLFIYLIILLFCWKETWCDHNLFHLQLSHQFIYEVIKFFLLTPNRFCLVRYSRSRLWRYKISIKSYLPKINCPLPLNFVAKYRIVKYF